MSSNFFLGYVVPGIGIAVTIYAYSLKKYWNPSARTLFYYMLMCSIFNIIAKATTGSNNLPGLHLYTVLEFLILAWFFSIGEKSKAVYFILMIGFTALAVWYGFFYSTIYLYNQIPRFTGSVLLSIFAFRRLIREMDRTNNRFLLLSISGLVLYYSTCSLLFGLSDMLEKTPKYFTDLVWNTHAAIIMCMYLTIAWAYKSLKRNAT